MMALKSFAINITSWYTMSLPVIAIFYQDYIK